MSYDESDAWEEAAHEAVFEGFIEDPSAREHFYEELYDEIVKDFTDARLRSFFEKEPEVAQPASTLWVRQRVFLRLTAPQHSSLQRLQQSLA